MPSYQVHEEGNEDFAEACTTRAAWAIGCEGATTVVDITKRKTIANIHNTLHRVT